MAPAKKTLALEVVELPIGKVKPDPNQPRRHIEVDDDFVQSIKAKGILQPITVRTSEKAGEFTISFGERRWTGAKQAGLKTVPTILRDDLEPGDVFEAQVMENVHRAAFTPMEESRAYVKLVDDFGRPQRELAKKIGRSQTYLSKHMSLALRLVEAGQRLVEAGKITVTDAILLASLHEHPVLTDEVIAAYEEDQDHGRKTLDRALIVAKRAKVVMAARKKLDDAGVTIADIRPGWQSSVGASSSAFGVQVDADAHAAEPCHVAYVDVDGDVLIFCTDRDRHRPEGDSDLKAPNFAPPPAPADSDDDDDPIGEFAGNIERGAATNQGHSTDDWHAQREREAAERDRRRDEEEAARGVRGDLAEIRRGFIRQHLADDGFEPGGIGHAFIARTYLLWAADGDGGDGGQPDLGIVTQLLTVEFDEFADDVQYDFGPDVTSLAKVLLEHPRQQLVALAAALSVAESRLGPYSRWNDVLFADVAIRQHYDYLTTHGYPLHDEEQKALDGGALYRRLHSPHPFESTGENEETGLCDTCGRALDGLGVAGVANGELIHTDAAERLAAIAEAEAADTDPAFEEFCQARAALDDKDNKKGKARTDAHLAFEDAKDKFAHRLVAELPDPAGAAERLQAAHEGYEERLRTVGPIRGGTHYEEDSAAFRAFSDEVLAVLETAGPLPAALRKEIAEREEVRLNTPPVTRAGTIKWVHVPDLVELLNLRAPIDSAADWELASTIPAYFDYSDDEATNVVAQWVDDHNLDLAKLTSLLKVEQANAEAIDRPFLRAALIKLISAAAGYPLTDTAVEPTETADETPDEPAAEDDIPPGVVNLSGARLLGLTVLAFGEAREREVRESNATSQGLLDDPDMKFTVYWQTSKWLVDAGYAEKDTHNVLTLTDTGRALASDHDVLADLVD